MSCPSETRLQTFVDGAATPAEIAEISLHLDECDDCRTLVGVVQPVGLDDETTTDRIGRYVLRRVLGKGGMGVVYEAVDPDLHRVVALKLLRSDLGAAQRRLLGEAEAMASLSHPNVVRIYDVGREGTRVFIVMELVHGTTLRHWLTREAPTIPTIVDAFVQAAEGLRAAHEAGLVHRDFKPDNVFVATEGRVLVGDFGLAAQLGGEAVAGEGSASYMAPEQRSGQKVDARSDQYAFAVSLDEALAGTSVPRWLSRAVARGKSVDPERRFPSMEAFVRVLRQGDGRARDRRRAAIASVLALGVALAIAIAARGTREKIAALCRPGEEQLGSVWSPEIAARIEKAFVDTKSPLADVAWQKTNAALTEYADGWRRAHRRACEEAARGDEPGRRAAEAKQVCLSERLEMMGAVGAGFEHADAVTLEHVPAMLQLLPRIGACEDVREMAQRAPPPSSDKAPAVGEARRKMASAAATIAAGRYADGLVLAGEGFELANRTRYLPALAEAHFWVGTAQGRLGKTAESEQALEHAVSSASAGHAPELAIRAWIALMHFVGVEGHRYDDGYRHAEYAKAALESMPGAFELEAERLTWLRAMLVDQKKLTEALDVSKQEVALAELRFGPEHRLSAVALDGLAGILVGQCKARDALAPQEKACAIFEKELGSPHPQLALCVGNLASLHAYLGEHERAVVLKQRALAMFERLPGHPNHVAMAHRNTVRSLVELGRLEQAGVALEAAAALAKTDADETSVLLLRGELRRRQGRADAALVDHELVVSKTEKNDPPRRLEPLVVLAETQLAAGRFTEASASARKATAIAEGIYGVASCRVALPLRLEAEALEGVHREAAALPLAERAVLVLRDAQVDPLLNARADLVLALALPPEARERARKLASGARDVAAADGRDPKLTASIDRWLMSSR